MILLLLTFLTLNNYVLQPNDVVTISISGGVNFTYNQTISPQGSILIQWIPPSSVSMASKKESYQPLDRIQEWQVLKIVHIAGLSIEEAKLLIEENFKEYFKNISLSLTVASFSDLVYVTGRVHSSRGYPYSSGKSVREYIEVAGGPLKSADFKRIRIERKGGNIIEDSLELIVEPGDIITVPEALVYIRGEVRAPRAFSYDPDLKVEDYIGMSGGPTDRASFGKSYIIKRNGEKVSLKDATIDKGDTIVIGKVTFKWWQDYLTVASTITSIVIAWLTIRN
ncbi:SLBB domain-containing protein [candidate division WOR-3 bacterium]|nr:SLBB domain-containing protein [candidate division WOR-3 bacterium]